MKKKLLSSFLVLTMVLSVTACSNKSTTEGTTASNTTSGTTTGVAAEEYGAQLQKDAEEYKKYVSVPEYKGIEVEVDRTKLDVADADVDNYITQILSSKATSENVTEGTTAVGDTVIMDFSGLLDGVAFSGGTATDFTYTIGSGSFIEDLDKGLAGLEVGNEYDIPCRFPDNYGQSSLAGKDVIFKVTVSSISKAIVPELNDEFVKSIAADYDETLATVEDLRTYSRKVLEENALAQFTSAKNLAIMDKIIGSVEVNEYPAEELETLKNTVIENVKSEFATYGSYYGITDFATYIKQQYGMESEDDMKLEAEASAKDYLTEKMIMTLIAVDSNITVTADEINEAGNELAEQYGYEGYSDILSQFGNEMNLEVGFSVLSEKVLELVSSNSVEI